MDEATPHEDARELLWARYELTLGDLRQLTAEPRVVDLAEIYGRTLLHLADFHDIEHDEIATGFFAHFDEVGANAEQSVAAAALGYLNALDIYVEEILGEAPERRGPDSVKTEIKGLQDDFLDGDQPGGDFEY